MNNHQLDILGIPSTLIAWLSVLEVVNINPMVSFLASTLSVVWLSMQIYGWVEKRIKNYKDASKQKSGQSS